MSNDKKIDEPADALIDLSDQPGGSDTAAPQHDTAEPTLEPTTEPTLEPTQQIIPQTPQPVPVPTHEARATPRYRVRWRAEIIIDAQTTYYGHLKDISIGGAAVLMEHNIKSPLSVTLFLEIPSANAFNAPHILQVEGKVIDTIYEGDSAYFRTGIAFRRFVPADELTFLDNHLKNNCILLL